MDLILEVRICRDRVTMACHGQLIEGRETEAFRRNAVLLLGGFDKLTINMAGVRGADYTGLWSLAAVLALAEERGQQVRITHPSPAMVDMLQSSGLGESLKKSFRSSCTAPAVLQEACA
jgi:anti-anti-sigma regulatory factor